MIAVPYHLGERGMGVGGGPLRIAESLSLPCHMVELACEPPWGRLSACGRLSTGLGILNRALAETIAQERDPQLILAGSCNSALGALAGLRMRGTERLGILWFDAHGDFNTPETSLSGSPDGMALAAAVGDCLQDVCAGCGLARIIPPENVILAAARDLDPAEAERLNASRLSRVDIEELARALESLAPRGDCVYLHIDIDVLDPAISPGVNCITPGGLTPDQLKAAIREVFKHIPVAAATIANYNPDRDKDNRTLDIACELAHTLNEALQS